MRTFKLSIVAIAAVAWALPALAQTPPPSRGGTPAAPAKPAVTTPAKPAVTAPAKPAAAAPAAPAPAPGVEPPADYVIGAGDVLNVVFWREPDMSAKVTVRPDGRISVPLLNDIVVSGLTPEQLRQKLAVDAQRFVQDPNVAVVVEQINSRRVFIIGQVSKSGPYPLTTSMNVLQLIATAGGLTEYADESSIFVTRTENGKPLVYKFNYKDVIHGKNLKQNIDLKSGDTVNVP